MTNLRVNVLNDLELNALNGVINVVFIGPNGSKWMVVSVPPGQGCRRPKDRVMGFRWTVVELLHWTLFDSLNIAFARTEYSP